MHGRVYDGTYVKYVNESKHKIQKPQSAWAMDIDDVEAAREKGANQILIIDQAHKKHWIISMTDFIHYRVLINRGYGPQWSVLESHWDKGDFVPGEV